MSPRMIALIVALLLAIGAGVWLGRQTVPRLVAEDVTPMDAQSLPSGAVVLERAPVPAVKPKPKKPGTKVERAVSVTVRPTQPVCDPVQVDLQLVQDGEGRRVVASSPDGVVVGGLDVPVRQIAFEESRLWAAGISYGTDRAHGVWIERDLDRVRVGAEIVRRQDGQAEIRARVGISW